MPTPLPSGILGSKFTPVGYIALGMAPTMFLSGTLSPTATVIPRQSAISFQATLAAASAIQRSIFRSLSATLNVGGAVSKNSSLRRTVFGATLTPSALLPFIQPFHTYVSMKLLARARKWTFATSNRMWSLLAAVRKFTLTVSDSGRASLVTNPATLQMATTEIIQVSLDLSAALVPGETIVSLPAPTLKIIDVASALIVYAQTPFYGVGKYGMITYGGVYPSGTGLTFTINGSGLTPNRQYTMVLTASTSTTKQVTVTTTLQVIY